MTLFMVAAVLAFLHGRNAVGAGFLFLGGLTSWEIVLVAAGILFVSRWRPELRRCAIAAVIGAGSGVICVAALYLLSDRGLAIETLQSAKFYMGFAPSFPLLHFQPTISAGEQVRRMLLNNVYMLGPLGLGAVWLLFAARLRDSALLIGSLSAPWLVWCVVMRNHMARHQFEFVIAAPFVALALAWMAMAQSKRPAFKIGLLAALAGLQILVLPKPAMGDGYDPEALIRYAWGIRDFTPVDSVVMAPLISVVPLYYSERHIVRGVSDSGLAELELPILRKEFPSSPIYVAVPPSLVGTFPGEQVVAANADVVILRPPPKRRGHKHPAMGLTR